MQSTRSKLIQLLAQDKNSNNYISGQTLSDQLNITRSAIWKHMNELKKDGYVIEGKARKGYRIISFPNKLSENTIKWGLNTEWLGQTIYHYNSLESTQKVAHDLAKEGAEHGTIIISNEQTEGRGRVDREWFSKDEKGIWMSFILRPDILPFQAPQLTLLTATVLANVINESADIVPQIKWPNDILINNKKMTGILTEMQAEQDYVSYIIVGMGINVNHEYSDLDESIRNLATSINIETKKELNLLTFTQSILESFEEKYENYLHNGFSNIKTEWEKYGFKLGHKLNIKINDTEWIGTFTGIAADGALLAQDENGETKKIYSAEITWF